jgi:hypothetical protein
MIRLYNENLTGGHSRSWRRAASHRGGHA